MEYINLSNLSVVEILEQTETTVKIKFLELGTINSPRIQVNTILNAVINLPFLKLIRFWKVRL